MTDNQPIRAQHTAGLNEIPSEDNNIVTTPDIATNIDDEDDEDESVRARTRNPVKTSTIGTPSIEPVLRLKPVPEVVKPPKPTTR